jgi:small subunit ribosomal protein S21
MHFFEKTKKVSVDRLKAQNYCLRPDSMAWQGNGAPAHLWTSARGSENELTEIRLKKGESVEKALRRLKKRIDREGTLKEVRNHRHFEKPSEKKRRKMKVARFSAMLSARYADL